MFCSLGSSYYLAVYISEFLPVNRYDYFSTMRATNFLTSGETTITVGSATKNENSQAFSQINKKPSINPIFRKLMANDIKEDMKIAMKNDVIYGVNLLEIKGRLFYFFKKVIS
jgi:hypothetical protein